MKILKIKLGLLSLLAVLAVSVFLTSCEQDALDITNAVESGVDELSFNYDKDIEILSENGLSKVTITASANDESLLNEIKQGNFKIIPVFEEPAEDLNQPAYDGTSNVSEDAEISDRGMSVAYTVNNVELEEGAIGYKIEVDQTDLSRIVGSGSSYWTTTGNKVRVDRQLNCVRAEFWKKQYSNSNYSYQWNQNRCDNGSSDYNWGGNSYRVRIKISGGSYYKFSFWARN